MRFFKLRSNIGKIRALLRRERGQASILIALMTLTFLLFFTFVVNTGQLISAKINLQNAADLAAYAGAATQARQLNQIAFLNYEMRRQMKKFLFRYYVVGNMSQKTHSLETGENPRTFSPGPGQPPYGVPSVCVTFNQNDNYCQLATLQRIRLPETPGLVLDPITQSLRQQYEALEQIRQDHCGVISLTNKRVLTFWLYNTDPELESIKQELTQAASTGGRNETNILKALEATQGIASGLGLIPRLTLLHQRILTLQKYINYRGSGAITFNRANELERRGDRVMYERPILAFRSAFNTLGGGEEGGHTFDDVPSIQLEELLPEGLDGANLLQLEPIRASFEAYYSDLGIQNGNCIGQPTPLKVRDLVVGVAKVPSVLTYYAVRLKAKAKILFSPFREDIELKAYAAAQPFGSRIGPSPEQTFFTIPGRQPSGPYAQVCNEGCAGLPNLPLLADDTPELGWYRGSAVNAMYRSLASSGGPPPAVVTTRELERAYAVAMAPNPAEEGKYTLPFEADELEDDPLHLRQGDPFVKYFTPSVVNASQEQRLLHSFWAPIVATEAGGTPQNVEDQIASLIDQNFTVGYTPQEKEALKRSFGRYITARLLTETGEDTEGFHVARLRDPLRTLASGRPEPLPLTEGRFFLQGGATKSSWADLKHAGFRTRGRSGYSVRFVSFDALLKKKLSPTPDSQAQWINDLPTDDPETQADLLLLRH